MFELVRKYGVGNHWISIMRLSLPHIGQRSFFFALQAFHHGSPLALPIDKEAQTQQKQQAKWHTNAYPDGSGVLRTGMS